MNANFSNTMYRVDLKRTPHGSPILKFRPKNPSSRRFLHFRQLAAMIYEVAAELERRSHDLDAAWVVSPAPFDLRSSWNSLTRASKLARRK